MFKFFKINLLNTRLRNLSDSNQAVVGIVVAVLLIGLLVTVLSVVQLVYVPNWMEETESEHIDEVFNQFCQLKLVIDTQTAINKPFTPIVTSINLGTNKIPFFMSNQAAGSLDIINDACSINISYRNETNQLNFKDYSLGVIRFTAVNAYYIPDQRISFIYENGALITNQIVNSEGRNALNIAPSFKYDGGYTVIFNMVDISGIGGKISKYGYDIEHIRTELEYTKNEIIVNVTTLKITTDYPDVWSSFIGTELGGAANVVKFGNIVTVTFTSTKDINIVMNLAVIDAQIGPGWVET